MSFSPAHRCPSACALPIPSKCSNSHLSFKNSGEKSNAVQHHSILICFSCSRDVLLFLLFGALAFALTLLLILQSIASGLPISDLFSELRVNVDGHEVEIVGRKLAIGDGDYFLDIPYSIATPRFQPTQMASFPKGFFAIHHGNGCPNGFVRTKSAPGINWDPPPLEAVPVSEQCHTLNIYRCPTSKNANQLLPVLVYVPEGHWLKRSNANLEPISTIRRVACAGDGVVVVSINYRMGPYGLFSAPHWPSHQRELALWDIRTALEWVQLNIVHFGGHRAHVTVMARGDGARLIALLGLLPGTQSLFKRQILLSGSAFMPALFQPPPSQNGTSADASMRFAIAAKCVNEKEWNLIKESRDKTALSQGETETRRKLDECVATLGHEAIIAADSLSHLPTLSRWPLLSHDMASAVATNPFANIPPTTTMVALCTSATDHPLMNGEMEKAKTDAENYRKKADEAAGTFRKRLEGAMREEMKERMRGLEDLTALDYAEEVIAHYLEEITDVGQGNDDPGVMFDKIQTDFFLAGPALLEAFVRTRLGSARTFALHFRSSTNVSLVDSAEVAANLANPWAASQSVCVDDLLFNPTPRGKSDEEKEQTNIKHFAEIVANFVTYGDPNAEERTVKRQGKEQSKGQGKGYWPMVYQQRERATCEDQPRWLSLNDGTIFNGLKLLFGKGFQRENAHFWLSGIAKRMGIFKEQENPCR